MATFAHFIYLFSLVFWVGSIIFFSFFTAPALFKTLDRSYAGDVIEAIFPKYYFIGYLCSALLLVTLLLMAPELPRAKLGLLAVMAVGTYYTGLFINPKVSVLKEEIKSTKKKNEKKTIEKKFKSLHSLAVKMNAAVLLAALGLLWLTAKGLSL